MTTGLPSVGHKRVSRPIFRQRPTSHSAQAFRSPECWLWADTLGKRTYSHSSSINRFWFFLRYDSMDCIGGVAPDISARHKLKALVLMWCSATRLVYFLGFKKLF